MSKYTSDDQWRSFQTFVAVYIAGMVHPRDVFTISVKSGIMPPLVEFRCDTAGGLWFGVGPLPWSDEDSAKLRVPQENINQVAAQTVQVLRKHQDEPSELRLRGSGPASSVTVLTMGRFINGDGSDPAREAVLHARMSANIDIEGDAIEAAARAVGQRAFDWTRSASIASIAFAAALANLRSWVHPFSPTPKAGYLVGGHTPQKAGERDKAGTDGHEDAPAP